MHPHHDEQLYWVGFVNSGLKLNLIKPIIQRWSGLDNRPLAELFTLSPLEWSTTFGLSEAQVAQVMNVPDSLPQLADHLAAWQEQGIEPIIYTDPRYPQRFIETLPPAKQPLILWTQGAVSLLNEPNIALLSDTVEAEDRPFLDDLTTMLVDERITLINGYGRGFERDTFQQVLDTPAGQAIALLPMGILAFHQMTPQLNRAKGSERVLLVSPFSPELSFNAAYLPARDMLIDHLAYAMVVLKTTPELTARSQQAIAAGLSLFTHNEALLAEGAFPLTDPHELVEMVQQGLIDTTLHHHPNLPRVSESENDYHLSQLPTEPINPAEALQLLASGGKIPPSLQQRLGS